MHLEQTQQYATVTKRKTVRKKKDTQKKSTPVLKNVVSLRVSDQEKRLLERLTRATSLNVSDLVREAIGFWLAKGRGRSGAASKGPRHSLLLAGNPN